MRWQQRLALPLLLTHSRSRYPKREDRLRLSDIQSAGR